MAGLEPESVGREPDLPARLTAPATARVSETPQALVLRLQSTAGNANVCRVLARDPAAQAAPAKPAWHKGVDAALPPDPQAVYDRLHKRCEAALVGLRADANSLKGDMKYWFARVYSFTTKREIDAIDAGTYEYPLMKMQEVLAFHATYKRNLDNWVAGKKGDVEPNWVHAFEAAEDLNSGAYMQTRSLEIMNALLPAMQAHIRFDLPRAIAACYLDNYAHIPGVTLGLFKKDFNGMDAVFEKAAGDIIPEIKAEVWYIDPGYSQTLQDAGFPFIFHIGIERQLAWEKAELLAASAHSRSASDMNKRLRGYIIGAHPNTGTEHFKIDGNRVDDFDWNAAP